MIIICGCEVVNKLICFLNGQTLINCMHSAISVEYCNLMVADVVFGFFGELL